MDDATNIAVFAVIVLARIGIPLAIPRYPLPSIIAALLIDAADQTIFQALTTLNLDGYQSYDKALDIYYLAIAYVATLRNWANLYGFRVSRFLWYYRLFGVTAFELSHWRTLLLIFPNTFEYFFIWYEALRTRWNPIRLTARTILHAAIFIWVFIKLPQEYWIHIAQLDTTDLIKEDILGVPADMAWSDALSQNLWVIPSLCAVGVALFWLGRKIWRRQPPADWPLTVDADAHTDIDPSEIPQGKRRVHLNTIIEKTVLVGLVSVIFAQVLPNVDSSSLGIMVTVAVIITANAFISSWLARRGTTWASAAREFIALGLVNSVLALFWIGLVSDDNSIEGSVRVIVFFVMLLTLIVTLFDRFHPFYERRVMLAEQMATGPDLVADAPQQQLAEAPVQPGAQ